MNLAPSVHADSVGRVLSLDESEISCALPLQHLQLAEQGLDILIDGEPAARIYPKVLGAVAMTDVQEPKLRITFRFPATSFSAGGRRRTVKVVRAHDGAVLAGSDLHPKSSKRKARALVLIPAGARFAHSSVELYRSEWSSLVGRYFNVGDMMVYDSTLKLLDYENIDVAKIRDFTDADVERYNEGFDYCFLRGSNYIHEHMQWERARALLERLRLPIYAIGVGAQAERMRSLRLSEDSIAIWKMIAERSAAIGVRGEYSAECLNEIGIQNVQVVGCPSLFRVRDRNIKINQKDLRDIRRIAFSLRREVSPVYSSDPGRYLEIQRKALLRLDCESDLTVTVHGEPEEKAFFFRDLARMREAEVALTKNGWLTPENREDLLRIYRSKLYMYTRADDYDRFIKSIDFCIGYRVHGILPALANGVPGALVSYDSRSEELARTHAIPLVSEAQMHDVSWREIYSSLDFSSYGRRFLSGYDAMRGFLEVNGLSHTL